MKWFLRQTPWILFGALLIASFFMQPVLVELGSLLDGHTYMSYGIFILILFLATVCMPVTVMPMIPMATLLFGPFVTGCLSVVGWTLGACGAFGIARFIGRPAVSRFISLDPIDRLGERIGTRNTFLSIVLLRLTLPVDVVSYALGLSKGVTFLVFFTASLCGVTWFSFIFAYLGEAFMAHQMSTIVFLIAGSVLVFCLGWYMLWRRN